MTMKEKTAAPALLGSGNEEERQQRVSDELWENCKGQCGADPWCRECMREKERLHKERLNRERRSDDKKE